MVSNMQTITVKTPTGQAVFNNVRSKKGYKALWQYIKYTQQAKQPFMVLPSGTESFDLQDIITNDYNAL